MPEVGDDLYVWQVFEENKWGTIATVLGDKLCPLVARDLSLATGQMAQHARLHNRLTGLPVRLSKFSRATDWVPPEGGVVP